MLAGRQIGRNHRVEVVLAGGRFLLHLHERGATGAGQRLRLGVDVRVPEQAVRVGLPLRLGLQVVDVHAGRLSGLRVAVCDIQLRVGL